jgi:hypothetical protein
MARTPGVRTMSGCAVWLLMLGSACTGPIRAEKALHIADTPEEPAPEFPLLLRPELDRAPARPEGVANPGCPDLRVFTDAEDLCARGIMPIHPWGRCQPMPRAENEDEEADEVPYVRAEDVQVAAFDGTAELFVKHYMRSSSGLESEDVYLALRRGVDYVLLARVLSFHDDVMETPTFERFVGDDRSVELRIREEFWDEDALDTVVRQTTVRCTMDDDGGIRCDAECPTLAIAELVPALDCGAVVAFDWTSLPTGEAMHVSGPEPHEDVERWGMYWDEEQLAIAADWLGHGHDWGDEPKRARQVDLGPGKGMLTVLELATGEWVLMHDQVPLAASDAEIRVGPGPGGLFVTGATEGKRWIRRMQLATHELDAVSPGPCGDS